MHDTGQQKVDLIINKQSFTVLMGQMKQFNQVWDGGVESVCVPVGEGTRCML